jgi:peptide deformylase
MAETMYDAPGVGLAATQVDVHERVVVIDTTETHDELLVFVNPEITWSSDGKAGVRRRLPVGARHLRRRRAPGARQGQGRRPVNKPFEMECDGLLAVCIQHEMDHLMGKVFVEYLSPLKRNRIKTKLLKEERAHQRSGRRPPAAVDGGAPHESRLCRHAGVCRGGPARPASRPASRFRWC